MSLSPEMQICDYVNACSVFADKQITVNLDTMYQIQDIFRVDDNLKSGLPGRPKKIRIILRNRLRELKKNNLCDSSLLSKDAGIPEKYEDSDPVQCFYKIISMCTTRELLFKCWPSLSRTSGILASTRKKKVEHPYHLLHKCMIMSN